MTKALFFDIDGTLVSFRTHRIPDSTIEALAAAHARGIRIFISTGRPKVIINNLGALQERQLIDGYITMNGAYCFVGEEVIYKSSIPAEDVSALAHYCAGRDIPCVFVTEHDLKVCQPNRQVEISFHEMLKVDTPMPTATPEEVLQGKPVFQMTPFLNEAQEEEVRPHLPHCETGRWTHEFVDITAKGNTKQRGMEEICRHFGLRREETMAFGDGGNDIPMLRHAGTGVAMGNAADHVKVEADYVTSSVDEEGVARALRHFGIIGDNLTSQQGDESTRGNELTRRIF